MITYFIFIVNRNVEGEAREVRDKVTQASSRGTLTVVPLKAQQGQTLCSLWIDNG